MRIGELARRTGVSARSLRYYEEQGLLASERTAADQRVYDETAVERVAWIRRLYAAGLSSSTLVDLLPCVEHPSVAQSRASVVRLREEHARLTEHIEELERTRATLEAVIGCSERHAGLTEPAVV